MRSKIATNLVCAAGLVLLGSLASAFDVSGVRQGIRSPADPTARGMDEDRGIASGVWIEPALGAVGAMQGACVNELGEVAYRIDASVVYLGRDVQGLRMGGIEGRILEPLANVPTRPTRDWIPMSLVGRWTRNDASSGDFDALIMARVQPAFLPPIVIGEIRGQFFERMAAVHGTDSAGGIRTPVRDLGEPKLVPGFHVKGVLVPPRAPGGFEPRSPAPVPSGFLGRWHLHD